MSSNPNLALESSAGRKGPRFDACVFLSLYRSLGLMKNRMFLLTAALLPLQANAETPLHALTISADTPEVSVGQREPGRGFLALPQLDYSFSLQPACADDWTAGSLSLSIADSRIYIDPAALDASASSVEAKLSVPARQLAPLPLSGFCEAAMPADEPAGDLSNGEPVIAAGQSLKITAALSAHAALLCESEDQQRMTYVTKALDINLVCDPQIDAGSTP